jgi:hypothetical protein
VILGYLLAVFGALGSGLGSVLESMGVRRAGAYGGDADDLPRIFGQPIYIAGLLVDLLGFACAAIALHRLPLFLVQSVMAFSIGVTASVSALLGTKLGRRGWIALAIAGLGLIAVGFSAEPGPAKALPPGWRWILLGASLVVGAISWFGHGMTSRWSAPILAFAAGLGFAGVAISARTVPPLHGILDLIGEPAVWSIVANGVAASVALAMALQRGSATTVSAIMFTTNTVLPSAVGLAVLNDDIRNGFLLPGIAGFLFAVSGAVALAHYSQVANAQHDHPDQAERTDHPDHTATADARAAQDPRAV